MANPNDAYSSDTGRTAVTSEEPPTEEVQQKGTVGFCPICSRMFSSAREVDEHMAKDHNGGALPPPIYPVGSSTPEEAECSSDQQQPAKDGEQGELHLPGPSSSNSLEDEGRVNQQQPDLGCLLTYFPPMYEPTSDQQRSVLPPLGSRSHNTSVSPPPLSLSNGSFNESEVALEAPAARLSLRTDSKRKYKCNQCHMSFPWHGDLTSHMMEAHGLHKRARNSNRSVLSDSGGGGGDGAGLAGGENGNRSVGSSGERSFPCKYCAYNAKYESELKRHMRLHRGVKPFSCPWCNYSSSWKGDLKRHIESHHSDRYSGPEELAALMARYKNNAGTVPIDAVDQEQPEAQQPGILLPITPKDSPSSHLIHSDVFPGVLGHLDPPDLRPSSSFASMPPVNDVSVPHQPVTPFNPTKQEPVTTAPLPNGEVSSSVPNLSFPITPTTLLNLGLSTPPNTAPNLNFSLPLISTPATTTTSVESALNPSMDRAFLEMAAQIFNSFNSALRQQAQETAKASSPPPPPPPPPPPQMGSGLFMPPFSLPAMPLIPNGVTFAQALSNLIQSGNAANPRYNSPASQQDGNGVPQDNGQRESAQSQYDLPLNLSVDTGGSVKPPPSKRRATNPHSSSSATSKEDLYRRHMCSDCGHRSNWKWDIGKHVKVAHPEREHEIRTITLSVDEARRTLPEYLAKVRTVGRHGKNSKASGGYASSSPGDDGHRGFPEGYMRPFQCTICGHRSNWSWDVKKHMNTIHGRLAEVRKLSTDEARRTIGEYLTRRRQSHHLLMPVGRLVSQQNAETSDSNTLEGPAVADAVTAPEPSATESSSNSAESSPVDIPNQESEPASSPVESMEHTDMESRPESEPQVSTALESPSNSHRTLALYPHRQRIRARRSQLSELAPQVQNTTPLSALDNWLPAQHSSGGGIERNSEGICNLIDLLRQTLGTLRLILGEEGEQQQQENENREEQQEIMEENPTAAVPNENEPSSEDRMNLLAENLLLPQMFDRLYHQVVPLLEQLKHRLAAAEPMETGDPRTH